MQYSYVATEYCVHSVVDMFHNTNINDEIKAIKKRLGALEILRQTTEGLAFLHANGYAHFNLKPTKLQIAKYSRAVYTKRSGRQFYLIKITDFRFAANCQVNTKQNNPFPREDKWIAPELADTKEQIDTSVDIFTLGLVYHYVLFGGQHMFTYSDREASKRAHERITDEKNRTYKKISDDPSLDIQF